MSFNPQNKEPFWDHWYIDKYLGKGSYGTVYRIKQDLGNKTIYRALKIIPIPQDDEIQNQSTSSVDNSMSHDYDLILDNVKKEIDIISKLQENKNIVRYEEYDIINKENEPGYYVLIRMECLTCLADYLPNSSFTDADVINLGKDLCDALEACQEHNILHRDIKPSNIFVSDDGVYKLGDFGIAQEEDTVPLNDLSIEGTYEYMAPELYNHKKYDVRSDIYSIGLVLYYILSGKKEYFTKRTSSIINGVENQRKALHNILNDRLTKPSQASELLSSIILKACDKNPELRYNTPADFKKALESVSEKDLFKTPIKINLPKSNGTPSIINKPQNDQSGQQDDNSSDESNNSKTNTDFNSGNNDENTDNVENADHLSTSSISKNKKVVSIILIIVVAIAIVSLIIFFLINKISDKKDTDLAENVITYTVTEAPIQLTPTPILETALEDNTLISPTVIPADTVALDPEHQNESLIDFSTISDLDKYTKLNVASNNISSIDELEHSVLLNYLNIQNNKIKELDKLSGLSNLTILNASDNQITDISPISSLTLMESLLLSNNKISSLEGLENLTNLSNLNLGGNKELSDISPLRNLTGLQCLIISETGVTDISPLYNLKNLTILDISELKIPEEQINELQSKIPNCSITQ